MSPRSIAGTLLVLSAVVCLTWNLATYPSPWFDEGLNVSAAKSLAATGRYGLVSGGSVRVLDPAIQSGPTVIVPVALGLRLSGFDLWNARIVMMAWSLLCLFAFWRLGARLYGWTAATLSVATLLSFGHDPFLSFLFMARQVLGEVAGLALFLGGLYFWPESEAGSRATRGIVAGVLFGLAMVTKSQLLLMVPLSVGAALLGAAWVAGEWRWRSWLSVALPAAVIVCAWYGWQAYELGARGAAANAAVLREGTRIHLLEWFNPLKMRHALSTLVRSGFVVWGPLALWLATMRIRRSPLEAVGVHCCVVAFIVLWIGWFVFLSIGWSRYAFPGVAISLLMVGPAVLEARDRLTVGAWRPARLAALACGLLIFGGLLGEATWGRLAAIFGPQDDSYYRFAGLINRTVPEGRSVESWEWELDLVTSARFDHPGTDVTNAATEVLWLGEKGDAAAGYSRPDLCDGFLVIGPFARWTGLYERAGLVSRTTLVGAAGPYELRSGSGCGGAMAMRP